MTVKVYHGDCLDVLPTISDASVDAVITDPPYPHIKREYGEWTEAEWWDLMMGVCKETRRILKPNGSAVFILQPNSKKLGSMRGWLWRFMLWATEEWNLIQDVWWWNVAALPEAHAIQGKLARPSLKACVWLGPANCYRDQESVLQQECERNAIDRAKSRLGRSAFPSGQGVTHSTMHAAAERRGGVTPFNVLPFANTNSIDSAGSHGHGAGTPIHLLRWWTRYICPPGGTVLDPFAGSGTAALAAVREQRSAVLIERVPKYIDIIHKRLSAEDAKTPLFPGVRE